MGGRIVYHYDHECCGQKSYGLVCHIHKMKLFGNKKLQEFHNHRIQILYLPAAPAPPHLLEERAKPRHRTTKFQKHGASCKTKKHQKTKKQNKQPQIITKTNQPKTQKIVFVYLNSGLSRTNFLFQPQTL